MSYFGNDKSEFVKKVFTSVASKYDIMNDVMSFGIHRMWKSQLINQVFDLNPQRYLDIATGSGDIAIGMIKKFKKSQHQVPEIVISDQNPEMLKFAKAKLIDENLISYVNSIIECSAENLEAVHGLFDCITVSFGARNFTNLELCIQNLSKIIAPGGVLLCLEFSPTLDNRILQKIYDFYSSNFIPLFGKLITNDRESYQYLVDSIRSFPDKFVLSNIMKNSGFSFVDFEELSCGICNIHYARK